MNRNIVDFPANRDQRLEAVINLYDSGVDPAAALRQVIELIDEGCDEAYYFAGCIYEEGGKGVERDLAKAIFYYEKSVDEFGYVEGWLALARLHYYGIGVSQNYLKAFEYYSTVAKRKDNAIAHLMLGKMYQHGYGIEQDPTKSREHYSHAMAKGNVYAIQGLALLEAQEGNRLRGAWFRLKAGLMAFNIGRKNMRDARLRSA